MSEHLSEVTRNALRRLWGVGRLGSEQGQSLAFLMVLLPMLLGVAGMVIEGGMILEARRELQRAVDAAALAGAQELPYSTPLAGEKARAYWDAHRRPSDPLEPDVSFSSKPVENDTITVTGEREVPIVLLRFVGFGDWQNVAATASARKGSLIEAECLVPIGLRDLTPYDGPDDDFGYTFGEPLVTLMGDMAGPGNWGYLDFGSGAKTLRELIGESQCLDDPVAIGDDVVTETGNTQQAIGAFDDRIDGDPHGFYDLFESDGTWKATGHVDCPRIILIPIISELAVHGKKTVQVEGFVEFFVSGYGPNPDAYVEGYFVQKVPRSGNGGQWHDNGIDVVRLIR